MALYRIKPTQLDARIANAISRHTGPAREKAAEVLSWGADEHVVITLALGFWLYARSGKEGERVASNHLLLTAAVVSLLPHLLKSIFDQERPDRRTVLGHFHGVPFSGKPRDAFPSGHAMHVGALASAATELPRAQRNAVWAIGAGLVATRIVLLAHWLTDVLAGLAIGVVVERLLRFWTGYGLGNDAD
jgi:membrane-associated phospholipid phosphatase